MYVLARYAVLYNDREFHLYSDAILTDCLPTLCDVYIVCDEHVKSMGKLR